jgi:hypothetical protein
MVNVTRQYRCKAAWTCPESDVVASGQSEHEVRPAPGSGNYSNSGRQSPDSMKLAQ